MKSKRRVSAGSLVVREIRDQTEILFQHKKLFGYPRLVISLLYYELYVASADFFHSGSTKEEVIRTKFHLLK